MQLLSKPVVSSMPDYSYTAFINAKKYVATLCSTQPGYFVISYSKLILKGQCTIIVYLSEAIHYIIKTTVLSYPFHKL